MSDAPRLFRATQTIYDLMRLLKASKRAGEQLTEQLHDWKMDAELYLRQFRQEHQKVELLNSELSGLQGQMQMLKSQNKVLVQNNQDLFDEVADLRKRLDAARVAQYEETPAPKDWRF